MFKSFAKGDPSILGFAPERLEPLHRRIQQFVTAEDVAAMRQREAQRLSKYQVELARRVAKLNASPRQTVEQQCSCLIAISRASEAAVRLTDRLASLYGLDAPKKVVEALFHIPVVRQGQRIAFDTSGLIDGIMQPVDENDPSLAGLQIFEGCDPESSSSEPPLELLSPK